MAMEPHGERVFWTDGRILMSRNRGPFNLELMQLSSQMSRDERIRLTASGPWGAIAIISQSAMITADALELMRKNMSDPLRNGNLVAAAFVLAPETEGRLLCEDILAPIYGLAGARFRTFETLESARDWVLAEIANAEPQSSQ